MQQRDVTIIPAGLIYIDPQCASLAPPKSWLMNATNNENKTKRSTVRGQLDDLHLSLISGKTQEQHTFKSSKYRIGFSQCYFPVLLFMSEPLGIYLKGYRFIIGPSWKFFNNVLSALS